MQCQEVQDFLDRRKIYIDAADGGDPVGSLLPTSESFHDGDIHRSVYASFDPLPSMEFSYASGDPRGCVLDRIPSKVSIACGCMHWVWLSNLPIMVRFSPSGRTVTRLIVYLGAKTRARQNEPSRDPPAAEYGGFYHERKSRAA